jgi:NitT/TauT family transport system substrate-binding protein
VRTDVLTRPDGSGQKFAKALAGAWYETMALMSATGPGTDKVLAAIAEGSQDTLQSYKEQLSTTHLLFTPQAALQLSTSPDMKQKMTLVKQFCFNHGLLGESTKSIDEVAIRYPDGSIQGKGDRVRLRFETAYMQLANEGKL